MEFKDQLGQAELEAELHRRQGYTEYEKEKGVQVACRDDKSAKPRKYEERWRHSRDLKGTVQKQQTR